MPFSRATDDRQMERIQASINQLLERRWTMAMIARRLQVSHGAVRHWRTGKRRPIDPDAVEAKLQALEEIP